MTSFVIILYFLKLITSLVAFFKAKLKYTAIFLFGSLLFDIATQIVKSQNHYPKPYIGYGFYLFLTSTFFYLAYPTLLLLCSALVTKIKTLLYLTPLLLVSIMTFVFVTYPEVSGPAMVKAFFAYYATLFMLILVNLIKNLKQEKVTLDKLLLVLLTLGGITECVFLIKLNYAWLSLSNFVFYSLVLIASLLSPQYKRLLPPSN